MKGNRLSQIVLAIFIVAIGYGLYSYFVEEEDLSASVLENIEALSSGESQNYDCDPPYEDTVCSYEGTVKVPGVKRAWK